MTRLLHRGASLLLLVLLVLGSGRAYGQTQTPGQIIKFGPFLNVVDSVITEDPSGRIGVGTTTPAAALDVASGDFNVSGNILKGGELFIHNSGEQNTFMGIRAGNLTTSDVGQNTGVGYEALQYVTTGNRNTAIGAEAMEGNTTGYSNTATGTLALFANTSGRENTANGDGALAENTTGRANTAIGMSALLFNRVGEENTAVGAEALVGVVTGPGNRNSALGAFSLAHNGGDLNTAIGYSADVFVPDLQNATAIGAFAVVNASNKIRFGNHQVTVIEGEVPYTFTSDKNQKENFQAVDGESVLRKLGGLNITSWNYIGRDPHQFRHYGPVAQEFFAAFGHDGVGAVGTSTTINSGDLEGILMIAVQALEKQNRELLTRIEALERLVKGTTPSVQ